ncbi:MAG: hypothetical protein JO138_01340 [Acidobacteriaceae bacterium]|nr:hypothetical protein [Acidobacteriaceae bacterium]
MTRITTASVCLAASVFIAYAHGAQPESPDKLLTQSPWAVQAHAKFALAQEEPPDPGPPPAAAQSGLAGNRPQGDIRWDGGVTRNNRFGTPTLNVLVRWDSATPIRQALQQTGQKTYSPEETERFYIITVVGLVPGGRYREVGAPEAQSRSDDTTDSRNPEQMLEELMASSRLVPRGKNALAPQDVKFDTSTGALHLFFPKKDPITLRDKEMMFYTRFGSMSVGAKFRLKDMVSQGKLEL